MTKAKKMVIIYQISPYIIQTILSKVSKQWTNIPGTDSADQRQVKAAAKLFNPHLGTLSISHINNYNFQKLATEIY